MTATEPTRPAEHIDAVATMKRGKTSAETCALNGWHVGGHVMIEDPWRCRLCGLAYPIPSMARDCERRHIDTDDDQETR